MKFPYTAILLSGLILCSFSQAESLSLEQCIEKALQNNKSIQQGQLNVQQAEIQTKQSYSGIYPSASLSISERSQNTGSAWNSNSGLGASVNQSIYSPGAYSGIKQAKISEQISQLNQADLADQIRQTVQSTYYLILTSEELIGVYQKNIQVADRDLARIRKMREMGTKTESDVLSAEVQKGQYESTLLNEEVNVKGLVRQLNLLMGESPDAALSLNSINADVITLPTADEARVIMLKNNREYKTLELNLEADRLDIKIAKEAYLPSLSASYSYSRDLNYVGGSVVGSNSVGMSASVGLFSGFKKKQNVQLSKINLENTEIQLKEKEQQLISDLLDYYDSMEYYNRSIAIQEKNLESAQKNFELVSRQYELGLSTILDQTNAQVSVLQSESSLVKVKYSRKSLEAQILKLLGTR